jgi:tetratricopeptide (TPR) repeat protein
VADTALSESVVGVPDVWRLRARGCWAEAAALLAPFCDDDAGAAMSRAELLVERCFYHLDGWAEAEDALRTAEALAATDDERGAAASERGYLAYGATLYSARDRADEASSAFGRSAALLAPGSAGRPLLDFRRGLVAENIAENPTAARAAYRRAHAGAVAHGNAFLSSFTWRHLAGLAAADGDLAEARHGYAESLRLRVSLGYLVGTAPALLSLAALEPDLEAARLRAEAARLYELLGGIPTWLSPSFPEQAAAS